MKRLKVRFDDIKQLELYMQAAEQAKFDIDMQCFSCIVDGRSILGILSFGLGKVLELKLHTEDEKEAEQFIEKIGFCICDQSIAVKM